MWLGPQTYNFGDIKPFFIFSSFLYFHIHIIHKYLSSNKKVSSQRVPVADMAVQNFVGDAFRGATWVALHNGGGVGW